MTQMAEVRTAAYFKVRDAITARWVYELCTA
jgi:hypothetical protein